MPTVSRTMAVLECFTPDDPTLPLVSIASRMKVSTATAYRIVNDLREAGYLIRVEEQHYCLSPKLLYLARSVVSTIGIREISADVMRNLARRTGEGVMLGMRDGLDRVVIEVIDSTARLVSIMRPGDRVALGIGGSGKVLMAYSDPAGIKIAMKRLRSQKKVDSTALQRELARIKKNGFSISHGEIVFGTIGMSVPIFDSSGAVNYVLSISSPAVRFRQKQDQCLALLKEAATTISSRYKTHAIPNKNDISTGMTEAGLQKRAQAQVRRSAPRRTTAKGSGK